MLAKRITSRTIDQTELTPFPTHSSALFVVAKNVNSFGIKQIHTLAAKHRGMGTPNDLWRELRGHPRAPHRFLYPVFSWPYKSLFQQPLSFHIYTKRGAREADRLQIKMEKRQAGSNAENEKS